MSKKIYISDILSHAYQGKSTGHYFALARNYKEMFGENVVVSGGPVYKTGFKDNELLVLPYNAGGGGLKARLKTFANAIKLFKEAKGKIIVLQQCTTITTFLCIALFYHKKSRLFMIQYSREGFRSIIGQFLFKLAKHKIDGIICPNETVGQAFQGVPYCVVPDYIYTGNNKVVDFSFENRKYDLCIVGRLAPEKGAVEVARKFANTQYKILIAGKPQTEELANELLKTCGDAGNIDLILGYVSDDDYYAYLHNSKYAILNYSGEYSERSSGVVFDTLFNGVPVVGKRCKTLQFIDEEDLGFLYSNINDCDFSRLLNPELHKTFMEKISNYREQQKKYKKKLEEFLND